MATPPKSEAAQVFGARVRERRQALDKSLEQLAEAGDIHWSFLGQVERGQRNVTLHNILRIAEALGVDASELVTGLQAPPKEIR